MKTSHTLLAIALLICLLPMPYGYFIFVRIIATIIFGISAVNSSSENRNELAITFGALAVLFQPFIKIPLGRGLWNMVDVVVAIFLLILVFAKNDKNPNH